MQPENCENGTISINGSNSIVKLLNKTSEPEGTDEVNYFCKETEICCKWNEDGKNTSEIATVIESNEIPKTQSRQCGKRSVVRIENRISQGDAAGYGE